MHKNIKKRKNSFKIYIYIYTYYLVITAPRHVPARFVGVLVQPGFDFVIGEECHVTRMCYCQEIPVPQN